MIELRVFGGGGLYRDGVAITGRPAQRHQLALLAQLAVSPRGSATRDKVIGLLWPEAESRKARHRLSVAMHVVRQGLGRDCLITSGDVVTLNAARVWSDVVAFTEAIEQGRLGEAVELFRGPFLDGFFLSGPPEFDHWVEEEQRHLDGLYRGALQRLIADAERDRDDAAAAHWWRRLANVDPFSASTTIGLMRALSAMGDLGSAIRHARAYAALVEGELEIPPDPEVLDLAGKITRDAQARVHVAGADTPPPTVREGRSGEPSSPTDAVQPRRTARAPTRTRHVIVMAVAFGAIMLAWAWARGAAGTEPDGTTSVAVVHFTAGEGLPDSLGRLLSERIAEALAYVPDLEAVARPARSASARRTGRGSAGTKILTGSLETNGSRGVLVRARLHDAPGGSEHWSRVYETPSGGDAALAEEVSIAIAQDLRQELVNYVPKEYSSSRRAYDRFLLGVYAMRQVTTEDLWQALQFHREAWEEDPDFALAHAIAGNAYFGLAGRGVSPEIAFELAREHVGYALALDSTLAEGHAALGRIQIWWDRDFDAGAASLRRAIMLYPTLPQAHTWYGFYLLYVRDRPEAAIRHVRRALEVDPLNTGRSRDVEDILYYARRYEEVEKQNRVTWSLDVDVARGLGGSPLGHAYRELGRYEESIQEWLGVHERVGGSALAGVAMAYGRMGRVAETMEIAKGLESRASGVSPIPVARLYASVGEVDRAIDLLSVAEETRPHAMLSLGVDPAFDRIRDDPRFDALLDRIGIPGQRGR